MSFQLHGVPLLSRFAGDRAETLRADERALKEGWAEALLLRVDKRGRIRFAEGALVLDAAIEHSAEPSPSAVFLGVTEGRHLWAVRAEELEGPSTDLRVAAMELDDFTAGVLATSLALLNWHDKANHSAEDGSRTVVAKGGWSRVTDSGHEEFPRIDPAVICLVHDGGDRVLLARQHTWPVTMFSLLAGFVEVGESLERCVEREIREEVGVDVREINYLGSQPWPFPRSLMLGFSAVGDPEQELVFSDGEIAEAHWFTRAEVRQALELGSWGAKQEGARLLLPGSISIARTIIESWAALES
ncbi:NAD(+) diphosphatase [Nocardia shimofusensis]|uniref:NAD(+) diphosphatase n=1 Tax=Nocardia shimofusensis TaxID=228596 RepID=UPI000830B30E|nr:NAD(+) diphosphatase [Nocardia shimofusensis]